jgi:hypothetical protein
MLTQKEIAQQWTSIETKLQIFYPAAIVDVAYATASVV